MPTNLKKLIRARMEKTGESWQTAARSLRAQVGPAPNVPSAVADALLELHTQTTFAVLVGRVPAAAGGPDLALVQQQADELARFPRYYAEAGSVSMTVTLDVHNLLIAHGAADDRQVQMIRVYPLDGEFADVLFSARTFSDRCDNCDGWVWCGEQDREDVCVCGQRHRVSFDARVEDALSLRQAMCCIDCGRELAVPMEPDSNPWRPVNRWQLRCDACHRAMPRTPADIAALSWKARRRFRLTA